MTGIASNGFRYGAVKFEFLSFFPLKSAVYFWTVIGLVRFSIRNPLANWLGKVSEQYAPSTGYQNVYVTFLVISRNIKKAIVPLVFYLLHRIVHGLFAFNSATRPSGFRARYGGHVVSLFERLKTQRRKSGVAKSVLRFISHRVALNGK